MSIDRVIAYLLRSWLLLALIFVFTPIIISFIFSFSPKHYPTLPLGGFSTGWYEKIATEATVLPAFINSIKAGVIVAVISTFIGFAAAYTDYRYRFFGKNFYLALALLPPTIPVLLIYLSRISLVGELHSVVFAHVVYCIPFAMALIRLRLAQMNPDLESAAWNLGANSWRAMRDVILPFTLPSIFAALALTMAVSFDEYMIAFFTSGISETLPVRVLVFLGGRVSPRINAVGSVVFTISMALVILAQILLLRRRGGERAAA